MQTLPRHVSPAIVCGAGGVWNATVYCARKPALPMENADTATTIYTRTDRGHFFSIR